MVSIATEIVFMCILFKLRRLRHYDALIAISYVVSDLFVCIFLCVLLSAATNIVHICVLKGQILIVNRIELGDSAVIVSVGCGGSISLEASTVRGAMTDMGTVECCVNNEIFGYEKSEPQAKYSNFDALKKKKLETANKCGKCLKIQNLEAPFL